MPYVIQRTASLRLVNGAWQPCRKISFNDTATTFFALCDISRTTRGSVQWKIFTSLLRQTAHISSHAYFPKCGDARIPASTLILHAAMTHLLAIDARVEYNCPFADFPLEVSHGGPVSLRRLQQQSGQLENLPILLMLPWLIDCNFLKSARAMVHNMS